MSTGLRRGDHGPAVAEIRSRLAYLALCGDVAAGDPFDFDDELDRAVRSFQQERGITVDGIVGPHTFRRLEEARWQLGDRVLSYVPGHLMAGDDVTELQRRLNTLGFAAGRTDGLFGVQTDAALREFQKGVGVTADGTPISLSDYAGKPVWLTFGASWCPDCRVEAPDIEAAYQANKDKGLAVVGVFISESADDIAGYAGLHAEARAFCATTNSAR